MAKSKRHGYLMAGDRPMGAEQLARIFGETLEKTSELLIELAQAGVYSLDKDFIFSRRMVKDEYGRKSNRDRVLRFRNGHVMPDVMQMKRGCNANVMGQRLEARGQRLEKRERTLVRPSLADWTRPTDGELVGKPLLRIGKLVQGIVTECRQTETTTHYKKEHSKQ